MAPKYAPHFIVLLFFLVASTGCDLLGTSGTAADQLKPHMDAPDDVVQGDSMSVRYHITNATIGSVELTSGGCLATIGIYNDENERLPVKGTDVGCALILRNHTLAPGASLTQERTIRMKLLDLDELVEPGTYRIRATPNIISVNGEEVNFRPTEHDITVRSADA